MSAIESMDNSAPNGGVQTFPLFAVPTRLCSLLKMKGKPTCFPSPYLFETKFQLECRGARNHFDDLVGDGRLTDAIHIQSQRIN